MSKFLAVALIAFCVAGCQKDETAGQSKQQSSTGSSAEKGDAAMKSMYGNIKTNSLR